MTALAWVLAGGLVAGAAVLLVRRSRRCDTLLAVADAGSFGAPVRRTWLLWGGLAAAILAGLAVFVLRADARPASAAILPPNTDGVIVIDLSSSTRAASKRIAAALLGLARNGRKLGLVVFSDTAYEALPPTAPTESLRDWLQLFAHDPPSSYPWTPSFSGGTWISSGLIAARRMLLRDGVRNGHVLLVSDLVDGPSDLPNLQSVISQYEREGIALSVISVAPRQTPSTSQASFLQDQNAGFLGRAASRTIDSSHLPATRSDPTALLVVLGILGLLAAVYELLLHPFTWRVRS